MLPLTYVPSELHSIENGNIKFVNFVNCINFMCFQSLRNSQPVIPESSESDLLGEVAEITGNVQCFKVSCALEREESFAKLEFMDCIAFLGFKNRRSCRRFNAQIGAIRMCQTRVACHDRFA